MSVAVFGFGNVLMRDDGFGPFSIRQLEARFTFPGGVELRDLGAPGLHLHPHFEDRDAVILIDTVRADGEAGEVRVYRRDDLVSGRVAPRMGPHDPGLEEALRTLDFMGQRPEVVLVGVIPAVVSAGTDISPEVLAAQAEVEETVLGELERLGVAGSPRQPPAEPDLWWIAP